MPTLLASTGGKRVLLLNPPVAEVAEAQDAWASIRTPPFALLRLAGWLRGLGAEVALLDALSDPALEGRPKGRRRGRLRCGEDGDAPVERDVFHYGLDAPLLEQRLADFSPDVIAVSATFTWHAPVVEEVVAACRRAHPRAKVVLGGNFPSLCPDVARRAGADETFVGDVPDAAFSPTAVDLLVRPPEADWLRLVKGCPNRCSYCVAPALSGGRVTFRSPDAVVAELKEKVARHGVRRFAFHDDAILYRRAELVEPLLDRIAREVQGVFIDFGSGIAAWQVDDALARRLRAAGVQVVHLALETLDPVRSREMHRPQGREQFERAVEILKAHGYRGPSLRAFYLVGMPDQTTDEILEALLWLYRLGVTPHLTAYTLTPGSEDHARYRDRVTDRALEELAPLAWRFASPRMRVRDLDGCLRYFSERFYPLERILGSRTDDPLVRRMQELAAQGAGT
ncbi:MAG TPA: radical SAM protein [Anaeromyxobacter sp.]